MVITPDTTNTREVLMAAGQVARGCCDRCPRAAGGATAAVTGRRLMKAAVFPARVSQELPEPTSAHRSADPSGMGFADAGQLPRAVSGTVLDVSPQVLVLGDETDTQRFTLTPDVATWRGGRLDPAALRPGDHAVLRLRTSSRHTIDRIWANIGRVTGVILQRSGGTLVVDEGATRRPRIVSIQPRALGRIQVRFPTLEPGYLIDIIGMHRDGELA